MICSRQITSVQLLYLLAERVLIDALVPAEGLSWFEAHGLPEHVLLTNRHHDFDHLLLAHGDPVVTSGREALRWFAR